MDKIQLTIRGYDKIANDWHGTRRHSWGEVDEIIKSELRTSSNPINILDLGCGNGRLIETLEKIKKDSSDKNFKTIKYLGVDPSINLINIAQKQYHDLLNVSFETNDGINIPCGDHTFEMVISIATLHHVPPEYQDAWLREVHRVSTPDAKVIITVWLRDDSNDDRSTVHKRESEKEMMLGFAQHTDIRYVYLFDQSELENLLVKNGFNVLESKVEQRPNSKNKNLIVVADIFKC